MQCYIKALTSYSSVQTSAIMIGAGQESTVPWWGLSSGAWNTSCIARLGGRLRQYTINEIITAMSKGPIMLQLIYITVQGVMVDWWNAAKHGLQG